MRDAREAILESLAFIIGLSTVVYWRSSSPTVRSG
jgi:hypothetical protein